MLGQVFPDAPPFAIFPARRQIPSDELGHPLVDIGCVKIRLERDGTVASGDRFIETPQHVQHDAAIDLRLGV